MNELSAVNQSLTIKRFKSQLVDGNEADGDDIEAQGLLERRQTPRRPLVHYIKLCRYQMIQYNYVFHYAFYTIILVNMAFFGAFDKGVKHYQDPYSNPKRFEGEKCPAQVEHWFTFYIAFCPLAMLISTIAGQQAKYQHNMFTYHMETWNRKYQVWTDNNKFINNSILMVDVVNVAWAFYGLVMNLPKEGEQNMLI